MAGDRSPGRRHRHRRNGATITDGLLDPQHPGWQPTGQIEEARRAVGDREIDVVLLSIGGNDVGFAYDEAGTIRTTRERIEGLDDRARCSPNSTTSR